MLNNLGLFDPMWIKRREYLDYSSPSHGWIINQRATIPDKSI